MKEEEVFKEYLDRNNLKMTKQREIIFETFFETDRHVTAEELYREAFKKDQNIGLATVYRTLNLFCQCGLAEQRHFGGGHTLYDNHNMYNHRHHDHLVCSRCWKIIEFEAPEIEVLQDKVAKEYDFLITHHKHELYGLCSGCKEKGQG